MNTGQLKYFYLLKKEIEQRFRESYPCCDKAIHQWKGQEITDFQEDLLEKVNERISEKWFYTHLKPEKNEKLPRIDVLNLLARYTGHKSWDDFRAARKDQLVLPETDGSVSSDLPEEEPVVKSKTKKRALLIIFLFVFTILAMLIIYALIHKKEENLYRFCFTDSDFEVPVSDTRIEISVLSEGETPRVFICDSTACFSLSSRTGFIRFAVKADYYLADTIARTFNGEPQEEMISLKKDDYSLMIRIFSQSDIKDWERRRRQLETMIAENAMIYQVSPGDELGMEMYTREEFIDKMTLPIKSLKNIEIIDVKYENRKIVFMRFVQQKAEQ